MNCELCGADVAVESDPDVVGQPYHGHAGVTGARHRTPDRGVTKPETVRTQPTAHLQDHGQEHPRALRLPADHCACSDLRR